MWERLFRCSHADAAESPYGAGGDRVRCRRGAGGSIGWLGAKTGLSVAAEVKGGGGCSGLSYRWVEGPVGSLSQVPLWRGEEKRREEERGESTTSVTAHGKHWNHLTTEVKTIFTETLQKE